MLLGLLGIAAAVAAGALITYVVAMAFEWLKNKIKVKMTQRGITTVVAGELGPLIDQCKKNGNTINLDDLEHLSDEGYSHFMVSMDANNQIVDDVELIKDTNEEPDAGVKRLLGREGMVVVQGGR